MLYRLLALIGLMASFPLSGQLSTRLLLHDRTYVIEGGDFSAAGSEVTAYDAVTDRFYGILHYAQTPDASELSELEKQGVHFNYALPLRAYLIDLPKEAWPLDGSTAMAFTVLPTESRTSRNMKLGNYPEHMMQADGRAEMELSLANGPSWTASLEAIRAIGFEVLETDRSIGRVRVLGPIDHTEQLIDRPFVFFIAEALPLAEKENDLARSNHRVSYTQQQHPTYDGRDVVVGVGDDRQIGPHIDFQGRIITDYSQPGSATNTHGDHVSGTVLGAGNIDPFAKGMAPGAELVYYPPVGSGHFNASIRTTLSIRCSFTTVPTPVAATAATIARRPNSTRTRSIIAPICTSSRQETMAIPLAAMPTSQVCRGETSQEATNSPRTSSPQRTSPILIFLLPVQARDPQQTDGSNRT